MSKKTRSKDIILLTELLELQEKTKNEKKILIKLLIYIMDPFILFLILIILSFIFKDPIVLKFFSIGISICLLLFAIAYSINKVLWIIFSRRIYALISPGDEKLIAYAIIKGLPYQ